MSRGADPRIVRGPPELSVGEPHWSDGVPAARTGRDRTVGTQAKRGQERADAAERCRRKKGND